MNVGITARRRVQWAGLIGGPVLAVLVFAVLPEQYSGTSGPATEFTAAGRITLALMAWMAVWWLTEAIDVSATAFLPLVVLPITGATSIGAAASPYADKLIFLFMGGFVLALAMQRWGLDRRIALITLRLVGSRPANMVAGVMLATAVLSMFVSNTATTAMMLPIALSVVSLVGERNAANHDDTRGPSADPFALCMMLGIAYAASIGGIGTKIGTPPNGLLLGFIEQNYGHTIGFFEWLGVGLPLVAIFLPCVWLLLTRVLYPVPRQPMEDAGELVTTAYHQLGPVKPGEWATFIVFCCTAALWMLRPILSESLLYGPGGEPLLKGLSDAGIAMTAALTLFVIPVDRSRREFVVDWETMHKMPWGIFVLFGGGLSLAAAVQTNGVAEFFGHLATGMGGWPTLLLILMVTVAVIFLTELTSNTATTATLLPILAGLAPGLGVHPYLLIVPAAIAASCAFMMPVATPPNAIVFGSGKITIPQMCRAGLWLNMLGVLLVTVVMYTTVPRVLGLRSIGAEGSGLVEQEPP